MRKFLGFTLVACLMGCATHPTPPPDYNVCDTPNCAPDRTISVE